MDEFKAQSHHPVGHSDKGLDVSESSLTTGPIVVLLSFVAT